jgi:hypothetical protein
MDGLYSLGRKRQRKPQDGVGQFSAIRRNRPWEEGKETEEGQAEQVTRSVGSEAWKRPSAAVKRNGGSVLCKEAGRGSKDPYR